MRFVTGPRYFSKVIYTGETYAPDPAIYGLLPRDRRAKRIDDGAIDRRRRMLAQISPEAFQQTKQQMRLPVADRIKRDGKRIDAAVAKIWTTQKAVMSIGSYVARTLKKWLVLEPLGKVGDNVVLVLKADRQPHHIRACAGLDLLRVGQVAGAWSKPG